MIKIVSYITPKGVTKVQSGLSLSPTDIEHSTLKGQASALGSLESSAYYQGSKFDVSVEHTRGADMNIIWESSKLAQHKINAARSKMALENAVKGQPDPKSN